MYKVFIGETPIYLTNTEGGASDWQNNPKVLVAKYLGKPKFLFQYIDKLEKDSKDIEAIVLVSDNLEKLWTNFSSIYKVIEAAGGVVFNQNDEILMIYRLETWDLPKGKIDKGESPEIAAVREVNEETGLVNIVRGDLLHITYHTYIYKEKRILKKTYWYNMTTTDTELTPQTEENIEKAVWVNINTFLETESNVYGNILDVLNKIKS